MNMKKLVRCVFVAVLLPCAALAQLRYPVYSDGTSIWSVAAAGSDGTNSAVLPFMNDAPSNSILYGRKNNGWFQAADVAANNTFAGTQTFASVNMNSNLNMQTSWINGDGAVEGGVYLGSFPVTGFAANRLALWSGSTNANTAADFYTASQSLTYRGQFLGIRYGTNWTAAPSGSMAFGITCAWNDGTANRFNSAINLFAESVALTNVPTSIRFATSSGPSGQTERFRIAPDGDVRYYNMTAGRHPVTASGYSVIASQTNELYVWDGAGNKTLLSPHNDANDLVKDSYNPYSGVHEVINLTKLAQAVEQLLGKDDPLKGQIYSVTTNVTQDWRENEKRQELESIKAREAWLAADKDTKEQTPEPVVYKPREVPIWARDAQKVYDGKYIGAEK